MTDGAAAWTDALAALAILEAGGGGMMLRARSGPVRDRWLALLADRCGAPYRVAAEQAVEALDEGTDLFASIAAGHRVARAGLAQRVRGRVLLVAGAERLDTRHSAALARWIDEMATPRIVLLDEGVEETVPTMLVDRVAMLVDLTPASLRDIGAALPELTPGELSEDDVAALCEATRALGIASPRVALHALKIARMAGAERAARLVLGPRAMQPPEHDAEDAPPEEPSEAQSPPDVTEPEETDATTGEVERIVEAARAVLPEALLAMAARGLRGRGGGSAEARRGEGGRGRPGRLRRGLPRRDKRLDLAATLIAAAPFQRMRGREAGDPIAVRPDDLRVRARVPMARSATIFVVDASGSAALARLAEVKGAIEHLLGESYVRRDEVALVAFRGRDAETVLPRTRSLARARRELAALPGGGATPLASGIVAGLGEAMQARAAGRVPLLLLLTDGGANIARDGGHDRARARDDAMAAARWVRANDISALVVDTSARPRGWVRELAGMMDARFLALPRLDADALGKAALAERAA